MKYIQLIIFLTVAASLCWAQPDDTPKELLEILEPEKVDPQADDVNEFKAEIKAIGKHTPQGVMVRWAPNKAGAWHLGNTHGYTLERVEISEAKGNFTTLSADIKPWPLDDWAKIATKELNNKYAAIAAQAIYGKSFTATSQGILDKADELTNRYSFTLFAADLNTESAEAAGLMFLDKTADPNKGYAYRVLSNIPAEKYEVLNGVCIVNVPNMVEVKKPIISNAVGKEKMISIQWNRLYHSVNYTAYWVERATSAKGPFTRLHQDPYLPTQAEDGDKEFMVYDDEVEANYKKHYYRLIGVDAFGQESMPSEVVVGQGRDKTPPGRPVNVTTEQTKDGKIKLNWTMINIPKDLKGYYVARSNKTDGSWQLLNEKNIIKPKTLQYIDENPLRFDHNIYVVVATDTANNFTTSSSSGTAIKDSIPPAAPLGLKGTVSEKGIVNLSWDLGPEEDLGGYKIFYSNNPKNSFALLTKDVVETNSYTDTIMVRTLTEKIYYKVVALDVYWNHGEFSEILELQRPDIVPPVVPVFSDYKVNKSVVDLEWICSTSDDVVKHTLYRRSGKNAVWQKVKEFTAKSNRLNYTDTEAKANTHYEYSVVATDDAGLNSDYAEPLKIKTQAVLVNALSNLKAQGDKKAKTVALSWSTGQPLKRIIVYRSSNGGQFKAIHSLDGNAKSYTDNTATPGKSYDYTLKGVLINGTKTNYSNDVTVKL